LYDLRNSCSMNYLFSFSIRWRVLFIFCIGSILGITTGECRIIRVPEQYFTIQEAIVASIPGDTVLVSDGFYSAQVNFLGKNIVVASKFILDHDSVHIYNTEINRSYLNEGVKFINGEGPSAQLVGFTISNCLWKGVYCKNSAPTIRSNIMMGNKASGVYLDNSQATVCDNIIYGYAGFDMGGPYSAVTLYNSGPVIERNYINGHDPAGNVDAIELNLGNDKLPGVSAVIRRNILNGTITGDLPDNGLPQLIDHNIITSRNGFSSGMNITWCGANLKIFNNTVTGGGGIWIQHGNMPDIRNNIVAYAQVGIEIWVDSATIAFNNLWECERPYSGVPDQTGINGNTYADPAFLDPATGDFNFHCWSPCIDAGDPFSDFAAEPFPNGGRINMGCYGNTPEADPSVACARSFPDTIDFEYVAKGQQKDTAWIVRNDGHAPLYISAIMNQHPLTFTVNYPGGPTTLNPKDSLSLIVTFHPDADSVHYSDSLTIVSNSVIPGTTSLYGHTALSVDPKEAPEKFRIYPVPITEGRLYLRKEQSLSKAAPVEIYRTTGELLYKTAMLPGETLSEIDLSGWRDGVYVIRAGSSVRMFQIIQTAR